MKLSDYVLPSDLELAQDLQKFNEYAIQRAALEVGQANYQEANKWVAEFTKGARDLEALIEKKAEHERSIRELDRMIKALSERGITIHKINIGRNK